MRTDLQLAARNRNRKAYRMAANIVPFDIVEKIVKETLSAARDATHWEESVDTEVLYLRLGRTLAAIEGTA